MPDENTMMTITLTRAQWVLIAASNPTNSETYTPEGLALYNAWQPILQAAAPKAQ